MKESTNTGYVSFLALRHLMPEIFPNDVRGMAMTVPVPVQWVANAIVLRHGKFEMTNFGRIIVANEGKTDE